MVWLIISFLGKVPISQILGGGQLAHMHVSACWAVAHVSYMKVAYTGAASTTPCPHLDDPHHLYIDHDRDMATTTTTPCIDNAMSPPRSRGDGGARKWTTMRTGRDTV